MYKKTCPICEVDSYSSAGKGKWICPYCDYDLSDIAPMPSCNMEEKTKIKIEGTVIPFDRKQRGYKKTKIL